MTHCRSYWGRGGTTHVIQGGHFWNQANANYAPFIVADPPQDFPGFRNYLLASARYDHGAGGAGKPGSDAIYGGHSHVGTMIYLGDNWPDEYRGHLFTHNLHGHQINQQVNRPWGSGFDTVHAGRDVFFCTDPKYVAVDLQYGPDGAVYIIDWYDQQHCHNPNTERWDRGSGRIYRMEWAATYKPAKLDLSRMSDAELVELQGHKNEWHVRTARRLLHERAQARPIQEDAVGKLASRIKNDRDPLARLRALWTARVAGHFMDKTALGALSDPDQYVRAWAIQFIAEERQVETKLLQYLTQMARTDPSAVVRLYLASAIQRLPEEPAWQIIEALSQHGEDSEDRNIPFLLWHGLAERMPRNVERAFAIADRTVLPQLADWIQWYAAPLEEDGLNRVVARLGKRQKDDQRRLLAGLALGLKGRAGVNMPPEWRQVAPALYASKDQRIVQEAESLAASFGDDSMFPRLREALSDPNADAKRRQHAFAVLSRAQDRATLPVFIRLLDEKPFRLRTINLLARFDDPHVPGALLSRLQSFALEEKAAALNTLTSRASYGMELLNVVSGGKLTRDQLTAFHVRQLTQLKSREIDERIAKTWGRFSQTADEKERQIAKLEKVFNEAPLWAYDSGAGRQHFQKICAQCHRLGNEGTRVGPELTGAGRNGIRYYLENVIDPDAVIGTDFQMTAIEMHDGEVVSGLLLKETPSALTLRTTIEELTIAKAEVARRSTSQKSMMPEGLLESLSDREQIELLKFLTSN